MSDNENRRYIVRGRWEKHSKKPNLPTGSEIYEARKRGRWVRTGDRPGRG